MLALMQGPRSEGAPLKRNSDFSQLVRLEEGQLNNGLMTITGPAKPYSWM